MFRIVICDDEATSLKLNLELTKRIMEKEQIEYEIDTFSDMEHMIDAVCGKNKGEKSYDLLLSDILTTGLNGIEAAKKLRSLGKNMDIVFISTTAEYALDGYSVKALRYLKKPVDQEELRLVILESYQNYLKNGFLVVNTLERVYRIRYRDIYYLESSGRDLVIHLKNEELTTRMKLSDVEKTLTGPSFIRCHRSYIVNLMRTVSIERYQITLSNGDVVPVSQAQYSFVKTRFLEKE